MSREVEKDPASLVDATLDEHAGCMKLVGDLEGCLDRRHGEPEQWLSDLQATMSRLKAAMREHFEREEEGPLFRNLPVRHPHLADSLARLEAEHPVMLVELDQAMGRAAALEDPEEFELRELNACIQLIVARIRRHEAAENELVIQAHWDEIGVGD
jgi:iron-sulfur cluster repair protein YtfE (RIC family)